MNDENLSKLLCFETVIKDDGTIEIPQNELFELKYKGFSNIEIRVYGNSIKAAHEKKFDLKIFEQIKTVQSIPDAVVYDFLNSKGKFSESDFVKRVKY